VSKDLAQPSTTTEPKQDVEKIKQAAK